MNTHKTHGLEGTHISETVNPTSYTRQHMHSQVEHFQQIRKVQLIKFNVIIITVIIIRRHHHYASPVHTTFGDIRMMRRSHQRPTVTRN